MKKIIGRCAWFCALSLPLLLIAPTLSAAELASDKITRSRLLATGGASTIEGSAGGGIVPMAVLAGYGAQEEQGAVAFASYVDTGDYQLEVVGGSWSWRNRVELSAHSASSDAVVLA